MTTNPSWQRSPSPASATPGGANDPHAGATPAADPGETPGNGPSDEGLSEVEALKAALKKANQESASHRHKAKELDELKAQIEAEKLSEKERLEKRYADLQSQHETVLRERQEFRVNAELRVAALQLGFTDANDAVQLIKRADIEYDDSGQPNNIDKLLKELVKAKPYLAGKPGASNPGGGATNPARSQSVGNQVLSWEVIGRLSPQEYEARRPEIMQYMTNNPPRFGQRLR